MIRQKFEIEAGAEGAGIPLILELTIVHRQCLKVRFLFLFGLTDQNFPSAHRPPTLRYFPAAIFKTGALQ